MYYIEKTDKLGFWQEKLKTIKLQQNKILLPIKNEISEKNQIKLAEKVNKLLQKTNSNKLVLSKEVHNLEVFQNKLYSYNYNIVDGKKLFEALACIILEYICENKKVLKEETKLSILVNDLSDYTLQNIKILSTEYKALNIVTNHIEKFKKLEDIIYSENGLMITVSNNKKKSLTQSNLILNIDFPQELINKYNINDEAIIVNIKNDIKINKKRFNGIVINDYEIKTKEFNDSTTCNNTKIDENIEGFDDCQLCKNNKYYTKELYEAQIYEGIPHFDLMKKIKDDNVQIDALFGLNGKVF